MMHATSPLLTRLRRHRGLWMLAVAVLLIKLASSSICLGDAPTVPLADTQTTTSVLTVIDSMVADTADDNPCLLGEVGDCHCACAHTLTVPTSVAVAVASIDARIESSRLSLGLVPAMTGSLLRPPIA